MFKIIPNLKCFVVIHYSYMEVKYGKFCVNLNNKFQLFNANGCEKINLEDKIFWKYEIILSFTIIKAED